MDNSPKQWFVANWLFHRWLAVIENHYHIIESNWTRLLLRPKPLLTIDHSIGWCVEGLNLFQSMTDVGLNKAIGHSINNWKKLLTFLSLHNFTNWVQTKSAILNLTRIPNPRPNQMQLWLAPQCRKAGAATLLLLMMQLLSKSDTLFNIHKCVHCCLMINLNFWRLEWDSFVS